MSAGRLGKWRLLLCSLLMTGGWSLSAEASGYCVVNGADVEIHVVSLDTPAFVADIPPGEDRCCEAPGCFKRKQRTTILMVVTGYVPVTRESHPGWEAECRIRPSSGDSVMVTGGQQRIQCEIRSDSP
ncbi:MAG: hypothetical protein HQL57_03310 [Magnetococcales bacterium]|nr:hypothetical protein [Magnetococcales bacterium]MBF0156198.1 hypothetical protein [Magnetococcales bacterium]